MNIIDNTSASDSSTEALRPTVTSIGSPTNAPSYDVAPEDQQYLDQLRAIDPFLGVPGPSVVPAGWRMPPLRATGLPPHLRQQVEAGLAALPADQRAAKENDLCVAALRTEVPNLRAKIGYGEGALPYHRAAAGLHGRHADLAREFDRLQGEVTEVVSYGVETDPATGKPRPKEVLRLTGPRRAAYIERMMDLSRQMRLIFNEDGTPGIEGARTLKIAEYESVQLLKERAEAVADRAEAKRRAAEMVREERIAAQAASLARMRRSDF